MTEKQFRYKSSDQADEVFPEYEVRLCSTSEWMPIEEFVQQLEGSEGWAKVRVKPKFVPGFYRKKTEPHASIHYWVNPTSRYWVNPTSSGFLNDFELVHVTVAGQ